VTFKTKIYSRLITFTLKGIVFPTPIPSDFNLIEAHIENRQSDEKQRMKQSPQLEERGNDE